MSRLGLAVGLLVDAMDGVDRFLGMDTGLETDTAMLKVGSSKKVRKGQSTSDPKNMSRDLSWFLRHGVNPAKMDSRGRVSVDVVTDYYPQYSADDIKACVDSQDPANKRIGWDDDGGGEHYVYCYQGHGDSYFKPSGPIDRDQIYKLLPDPCPFPIFHNTQLALAESIMNHGLIKGTKQSAKKESRDIHMWSPEAEKKGRINASNPVVIKINVAKARENGVIFRIAGNGVILSENDIPSDCLSRRDLNVTDGRLEAIDWTDPFFANP
jgi:hypothetical protein